MRQSDATTLVLVGGIREADDYIKTVYDVCPELKHCEPGKLECAKLPKLKNVVLISKERQPGMFAWDDVIEMGRSVSDAALQARQDSLDPHDVINMQYTSGTTGFPKGVMLTHTNLIGNAKSIAGCMALTPPGQPLHSGAVLPLLRLRSGNAVVRRFGRLHVPGAVLHPHGSARGGRAQQVHGPSRGPHHVYRRTRRNEETDFRYLKPSHGYHGRIAVPHRGHEEGGRRHGGQGDDDCLRPDRGLAGDHPDPSGGFAGTAGQHRRMCAAQRGGQDRRSGHPGDGGAGGSRESCAPAGIT